MDSVPNYTSSPLQALLILREFSGIKFHMENKIAGKGLK